MARLVPAPLCLLLLPGLALCQGKAASESGLELFEKNVRPVLAERCYRCHSSAAKKVKGGLVLDSRQGMLKGGDSGPAVVPGRPAESLLVRAIRHVQEDLKMPPNGKLPPQVVADIERWVALGAPTPAEAAAQANRDPWEAAARHWAFQPIRPPRLPEVRRRDWPVNAVDAFVLARLEARGLTPSPAADRRTLLRRVSFDLTGLPPTAEEVEAFERDTAPDAYARVVERLLASPAHGERWGRHWLDVARFADTKDGVLMYGDDRIRPFAYTYRDYVIQALNDDVPFDRFVHEQLAADLIEPKVEPARLAAMGFLTLGRMFDSNVHDVIDDRIDVVTRGLLGLTVACARCHDHKYDPIPTADYYALHGVFASSEAPLVPPPLDPALRGPMDFENSFAKKERELQDMLDRQYALLSETARARVADYLVHVASTEPDPLETAVFFRSLAPGDLRPQIVARWRAFLLRRTTPEDPLFGPWHDLFGLDAGAFPGEAAKVVARWQTRPQLNVMVREALTAARLTTKVDVARTYGALLKRVYEEAKAGRAPADPTRRELLDLVVSPDSPAYFRKSQTRRYMSRGETDAFGRKLTELDRLAVRERNAPPRAMCLLDAADLYAPRVLIRGNPARPGESVPRRFLRILAGEQPPPFAHGSGRLDLARAITDPANPLTSRVIVNRVWMHHFGEPLVASPSDFGLRTAPPTHPELLDYLAWTFMREGWSLKQLHRSLVLSRTYQQASQDRPACRQVDPENRLLWRANRRRLDFEAMRDSYLAVAGSLDRKLFGRPVDVAYDAANRRRTVYGLVDRQSLPGLFRAFDFAVPDQSVERRPLTSVPQQALFGMNAPFMIEQARALAARPEVQAAGTADERIRVLYRLVLARPPAPREVQAARRFLQEAAQGKAAQLLPVQQLAQVLLLTNEAMFVD